MFEEEYVNLVIKPKIDLILEAGVESVTGLLEWSKSTGHSNLLLQPRPLLPSNSHSVQHSSTACRHRPLECLPT